MKRFASILVTVITTSTAGAAVVSNSLNDSARIAAAAAYEGKVVAVIANYPAGTTYAAGSIAASGSVVNNRWILTSRHFIDQYLAIGSTFVISPASNWRNNSGSTFSVENWVLSPDPNIDLALLKLNGLLPGAINAVFASPVIGELNYYVGYGVKIDLSDNSQVYSGDRRLFTGVVDNQIIISSSPYVFESQFTTLTHDPFAGKAWSFDSGGGVFDSSGRQTGTMLYQGGGPSYGLTGSQDLGAPAVREWISQNISEPATPVLQTSLIGNAFTVSWGADASGWVLQKSANLRDWEDLGSTIITPGFCIQTVSSTSAFFRLNQYNP